MRDEKTDKINETLNPQSIAKASTSVRQEDIAFLMCAIDKTITALGLAIKDYNQKLSLLENRLDRIERNAINQIEGEKER